jgi:hypothetical protein
MSRSKMVRGNPTDLSKNGASKREKIREMLSAVENYNPQEIAEIVGTTPANVWKEKSKLKTEGLILRSQRRRLQVSERKDEMVIIPGDGRRKVSSDFYNYSPHYRFFNIRGLDEEGLKTLYSELKDGKKPADIIAQYGFHPEVVEKEYQRFLGLNEHKIIGAFQKEVIPYFRFALTVDLVDKFDREGFLSVNEFKELIELSLNRDEILRKRLEAKRNQLNRDEILRKRLEAKRIN